MKKILCPTDFSETAIAGVTYAAKLAKKMGAGLTLLNVQSLAELSPAEALLGKEINVRQAEGMLEEQCQEVAKVFKISCLGEVATAVGSLNHIIAGSAEGHELIVMGTNGPDDIFQFFSGSNSYQVIRNTNVPVWIVPRTCGYSDVRHTIYAFDLWRSNRLPMGQLIRIIKALESRLTVLQIMEESISLRAEEELKEDRNMMLDLFQDEVSMEFDTLHTGKLAEGLNDYMLEKKADLLALFSEHQSLVQKIFHRSLVKAISKIATYPVLAFHA